MLGSNKKNEIRFFLSFSLLIFLNKMMWRNELFFSFLILSSVTVVFLITFIIDDMNEDEDEDDIIPNTHLNERRKEATATAISRTLY